MSHEGILGEMKTKVQLAFGSVILTLLVVRAIFHRGMGASSESDRWVRHTNEVFENLRDIPCELGSIESSYRGIALTGKESYLKRAEGTRVKAATRDISRRTKAEEDLRGSKKWLRISEDLQLLCTDVCVALWAETVVNRNEILA
jgi:CHASE3 domain sensor protein